MAEEFSRNRLYEYAANSNLVLESERDGKRRSDEGKGEVETLRGKVNTIKMGERSRVKKTGNDELNKQASTNLPNKKQRLEETFETSKKQSNSSTNKFGHVLKVSQEIDNSIYQPTSLESRLAFEEFLSIVKRLIGDQPESILLGAATELLTVLKDDSSNNIVKESELSKLLSVNISGYMHKLLHTSGRISDFKLDVQTFENPSDISTTQKSNAEEGMAVVFDDEIDDENMRINDGEDENDDDPLSDGEGEDGIVNRENTYRNANEITDIHQEKGSFNDEDVLDPTDIDAYWLQRQLSKYYSDSNITSKLSEEVLETLKVQDDRFCENQLVVLLDFDKFALIKILMKNRFKLNYCIRLKQAQSDTERMKVEAEMKVDIVNGGIQILQQLESKSNVEGWAQDRLGQLTTSIARTEGHKPILNQSSTTTSATSSTPFVPDIQLNLEDLTFGEGGHLMANIRCELPEKSWRAQKKGYEEVHVPALKAAQIDSNELTAISSLPTWMHAAFSGVKSLNRIQSKMANAALFDSHNLLLCAPTGSGKTNVALLCMLGVMNQYRDPATDRLRLDEFKIVYIAPMKALVQECVQNFSKKLQPYGIICKELSGDQSLSKSELETTNIIVTTPEKWDIVTRKSNDKTFTQLVRLIIIDEIHLLHDDRGCVLEAIVARTLRTSEFSQDPVRLVGLSATLPNYEDVAAFLRVEADKGLFFFDSSYRPVPLQQQFIGVTEKKAIKKIQLMNEICYEKSLLHAGKNQILIFTHSRADTVKTAKAIRDMAVSNDTLMKFIKEDSASSEILKSESANIGNSDLKDILPYGFAVHHAGLSKSDRTLVEDLFADKHIQVLVSTATLAWGINLPCHTVIIKGTQIYSPEKGGWSELSPLDVLQMMGRAGRYGLDSEGEGIILTNHSELQYYLSLMNQQLPIESQLIKKLPDLLNAEIVAGSITNINDAAHWLGYTYLYIRMLKNPVLYNCISNNNNDLFDRRLQLAYAGINVLEKNDLIKFDRTTGFVAATYLGKISSYYYINNETISTYKSNLRSTMNEIDIFRLFSMSGEFKYLQVREEEKLELSKLLSRVPVPIKETVDEPIAKINALLQAYISRLSLEGFSIVSDMVYVQQSAGRLMRALFEIALAKKWASLAEKILDICKMIERRLWLSQCPLRQFTAIPDLICRKLEKVQDIHWDRYSDLKPHDLGELVKMPKMGKTLFKFVHMIPKLIVDARAHPLSRNTLEVNVSLTSDFEFNEQIHGYQLLFWLVVEDGDGDRILYYEPIILKSKTAALGWHFNTSIFVKLYEPLQPQYFLKVISDRWMHSSTCVPISFKHIILPAKGSSPSELLDLRPLPTKALPLILAELLRGIERLNPIQTQLFSTIYEQESNALVCAPVGSGKTVCIQLAIIKFLTSNIDGKCLYIAPSKESCESLYRTFGSFIQERFGVDVALLTGEQTVDLAQVKLAKVIFSTPNYWNSLSKKWRQRKAVQEINLYIFDDLQFIQSKLGALYEMIISRSRFIESQLGKTVRYIGLCHSLLYAKDMAEWLNIPNGSIFNFSPDCRPGLLDITISTQDNVDPIQRIAGLSRQIYSKLYEKRSNEAQFVFIPTRKQAQLLAIDLMYLNVANDKKIHLSDVQVKHDSASLITDNSVRELLENGIGFIHEGLSSNEVEVILNVADKACMPIVFPFSMHKNLPLVTASHVILCDIMIYNGHQDKFENLSSTELLDMLSHVKLHSTRSFFSVFCHPSKVEFIETSIYQPLPIESYLSENLHDHLLEEITSRTIETKADAVDYLTWTYLYRRLDKNPNFYGLNGTSMRHLSDFLSEIVENTIQDLENEKMLMVENEFELVPLNLGMISSHYNISHSSIEMFASTITERTKLNGIIEILTNASEFEDLKFNQDEIFHINKLGNKDSSISDKIVILLQCYFTRQHISMDLTTITSSILAIMIKLLPALIDVIASQSWLKPALAAMELSQMLVQGVRIKDSPLLQIPHLNVNDSNKLEALDPPITNVFEFIELDDEIRQMNLQFSVSQWSAIAKFCNSYPTVDFNFELASDHLSRGDSVIVNTVVSRDADSNNSGVVMSGKFPHRKIENWYVVLGDPTSNKLYAIKRIILSTIAKTKLEFQVPDEPGDYTILAYLMCDSYLGCDQEYEFTIHVK